MFVVVLVEQKRRMSQIELTKMALKKVDSDSEDDRVSLLYLLMFHGFLIKPLFFYLLL